eukprot:gnl/MRDRNA2_/MRDRNA2_29858_c0_seq1.p1 gnl/MRDRNA2_/MRDRNA2_29858_c0~~gnl/MRDRNA2_/MRDRNA2_29858_c0_seq1.p1  ORF type:complete len:324 (-),score=77.19 gnl/MRDRNA2_/MRDRNA2_29858_c0_seq1:147-1118(-)
MPKHSQNAEDRMFYSYRERQRAGYAFTKKDKLGTDAFLPFGYCALSCKVPKDPVATPDGYIFDREHILEYILQKKRDLAEEAQAYGSQEHRKEQKKKEEEKEEKLKELEEFNRMEHGLLSSEKRHAAADAREADKLIGTWDKSKPHMRKGELLDRGKIKPELTKGSFWAAVATQTAEATEKKKPDTVRCPMSGKKLRMKDLIDVKMEILNDKAHSQGGERGVFGCALSKRAIVHQKAVLLKPSGIVIEETMVKDCVLKDMKCPLTGKEIKKSDIIKLVPGKSGYQAHNETEVTRFNHIRCMAADNRLRESTLGNKGTAQRISS